jgi:hypothetical protein
MGSERYVMRVEDLVATSDFGAPPDILVLARPAVPQLGACRHARNVFAADSVRVQVVGSLGAQGPGSAAPNH